MRNYIRYVILLAVIIIFGFLCISAYNKATAPKNTKSSNNSTKEVVNKNKTKKTTTTDATKTEETNKETTAEESNQEEQQTTNNEIDSSTEEPQIHDVPNTATGDMTESTQNSNDVPLYSQYKKSKNNSVLIISTEEPIK